jgi:hypothetical protein
MLLVTVAVILLVPVAAGAPAETTPSVRVDSLGLFTAGFGHFSLALGLKLGTSGTLVPRAGLFPKLACLPAASALATPPHCRHEKQDQQQHGSRDDDDYQSGVHLSSSAFVPAQVPVPRDAETVQAHRLAVALFVRANSDPGRSRLMAGLS